MLGMTDPRLHEKHGLEQPPIIPGTARTELEVGRIPVVGIKPGVAQDQPPVLEPLDQWMKPGIVDVGWGRQPTDDPTPGVDQPAELEAHDPAVVRLAFATDLGRTSPFGDQVDQSCRTFGHQPRQLL